MPWKTKKTYSSSKRVCWSVSVFVLCAYVRVCICLLPASKALWALITLTNSSVLAVRYRPCSHAWGWGLIGSSDTTHSSSKANTSASLTNHRKQTRTTHTNQCFSAKWPHTHIHTHWNEAMWCQITAIMCNIFKTDFWDSKWNIKNSFIIWHIIEAISGFSDGIVFGFWDVCAKWGQNMITYIHLKHNERILLIYSDHLMSFSEFQFLTSIVNQKSQITYLMSFRLLVIQFTLAHFQLCFHCL